MTDKLQHGGILVMGREDDICGIADLHCANDGAGGERSAWI
jgi:hypothetical protein